MRDCRASLGRTAAFAVAAAGGGFLAPAAGGGGVLFPFVPKPGTDLSDERSFGLKII
jgi:hypothetical protein